MTANEQLAPNTRVITTLPNGTRTGGIIRSRELVRSLNVDVYTVHVAGGYIRATRDQLRIASN